jgi:hypothetical protein
LGAAVKDRQEETINAGYSNLIKELESLLVKAKKNSGLKLMDCIFGNLCQITYLPLFRILQSLFNSANSIIG